MTVEEGGDDKVANGKDAVGAPADASDDGDVSASPSPVRSHAPAFAGPPVSKLLRAVYWGAWFGVTPIALASLLVWGLTPASSVEGDGPWAWLEAGVRAQPVPIGIVAYTVFATVLWFARLRLPLARHAHPPLRPDLAPHLRAPVDRARSLLEEADAILRGREKDIQRDLSLHERKQLDADLEGLRAAMDAQPFDEEAFVDALVRADGEVDVRLGRWRKSEVREYLESILIAVAVALALRQFVVEAFKIPSGSMIPTLQVGDHIFVNKFVYGPAIPGVHARVWTNMPPSRGDVMVFAFPERPEQDFIKRVIALPGDKLEVKNGHPWLNGWQVPNCYVGVYSYNEYDTSFARHEGDLYVEYLEDEAYLTLFDRVTNGLPMEIQGPFTVQPGEVWVMGDNRNNSHDSRMWWGGKGGGVPYANIKGRALFVWLSLPETGIDWSRIFAPVMGRPRLPAPMKALQPAMDRCFKERPPLDKTHPPR